MIEQGEFAFAMEDEEDEEDAEDNEVSVSTVLKKYYSFQ